MSKMIAGIVLSITPYQEASAMSHVLTKDYGLLRFVLQGFYKPSSKMQSLGIPFSEVTYRTDYKENRLLKCYGGQLIHSYNDQRHNYDWLVWMSMLAELINHHYDISAHIEIYDLVLKNFKELDYHSILELMVALIAITGLSPYLQGCVVCDDHRINSFSLEKGGYTCQSHSDHKESYEYLVLLGQAFNDKKVSTNDETLLKEVIIMLVRYLEFHTNIKTHSIALL